MQKLISEASNEKEDIIYIDNNDNSNNSSNSIEESELTPDDGQSMENRSFLIENPSQEYYAIEGLASQSGISLKLQQLTEDANEIIDTE
ncbi:MAG: hypothetical protein K2K24_00105, partial [Clostridia bacterium]|nr:hypothetical protein [Clostridia bacterium]